MSHSRAVRFHQSLSVTESDEISISLPGSSDSSLSDQTWARKFMSGMAELYETKCFTDVVLKSGDSEFPCHKVVLVVSSPFFRAMFSHNFLETQSNKIEMNNLHPDTLELMLHYLYNGNCSFDAENVQDLLSAANLLQLDLLKSHCESYMLQHVSLQNCIEVFFFAKVHQCDNLSKKCWEFLCSHFRRVSISEEFCSMPVDCLKEIIASNDLDIPSEELVFEAVMRWINHDIEEREKHLFDIIVDVRVALVNAYYFFDKIENNELVKSVPQVQPWITKVRAYHMLSNRRQELDLNLNSRLGMSFVHGIIAIGMCVTRSIAFHGPLYRDRIQNICLMTLVRGQMKYYVLTQLPETVRMPGCAMIGENSVYIAGGRVTQQVVSTPQVANAPLQTHSVDSKHVNEYNTNTGMITKRARMRNSRSFFSLVVVDRFMYAVGGISGTTIHSLVEKYDPASDVWSRVPSLPISLACMAGVSYKGKLYIFGGVTKNNDYNRAKVVNSCYCFDPSYVVWTKLPPMQKSRVLTAAVVYRDKIYVCGGKTSWNEQGGDYLQEVEIFDPADDSWSLGPPLPISMGATGLVKYNGTLYIISGESASTVHGYYYLAHDKPDTGPYWRHEVIKNRPETVMLKRIHCCIANVPKSSFLRDQVM